jgi:hypothetical protein
MAKLAYHHGEHVLHIYRQAKAVLAKPLLLTFLLLYIPWFFLLKYGLAGEYRTLLFIYSLAIVAYALREYIVWRLNKYIITDKRLISIIHLKIFRKLVIETPLERILNVSFKTTGMWSSLMGFGNVEVQVVGLMEPIILRHIRRPSKIKDYLWHLHSRQTKTSHAFSEQSISDIQEQIGYTKANQKIL